MAGTVQGEVHAPLAILNVQQIRERRTVVFCREWSSREANWREARSSQSAILFLFFIEHWKKNWSWYFKRNISRTSRMTRNMTSCWARECSPVDSASEITWVEYNAWFDWLLSCVWKKRREKTNKMVAWQSCEGGFFFVQNWFLRCYFKAYKHTKESVMSVSSLVGTFDDIVRSTSVLAEGIEGGLWSDSSLVVRSLSIVLLDLSIALLDFRCLSKLWTLLRLFSSVNHLIVLKSNKHYSGISYM